MFFIEIIFLSFQYMKTDLQMFMDGLHINKQNKKMDDYVMKTKLNTRNYKGMTVYYTHKKTDNVTLFINGGAVLKLTHYLQKLIDDLQIKNNILVFENKTTLNLKCIGKMVSYIRRQKYKSLTIIGCSMGGVIGSHILSRIDIEKKKLICIDTPFCIYNTIPEVFEEQICFWRPDIFALYKLTIELVQGSYNYTDIFKITTMKQYEEYIFTHFGITNYEFLSTMNPNIKGCKIISFYNEEDPVVIRSFSIPTVQHFIKHLDNTSNFKEIKINDCEPGHCTEWAEINDFMKQIIEC